MVHIRLATGLPVDHMPDAVALKKSLIGQHLIQTDQAHFVANIVEVMCMPQPYGTIYRQMLLPSGQLNACHVATRTGVVDIGTYTIDLTLDDNGEYIQARSGSIEAGVYTAQQRIANVIEDKYREKPDYRMVEQVLRTGCLMVRGESENYSEEVAAALDPLRDATLNLMNEKWSTGVNVDAIYLSGGGAEYVHKAIKVHYPQTQKVDDAQLANARGYLHYANFAALDA